MLVGFLVLAPKLRELLGDADGDRLGDAAFAAGCEFADDGGAVGSELPVEARQAVGFREPRARLPRRTRERLG